MYQSPLVVHPPVHDVPCADTPCADQSYPDPMFPTMSFPDLLVTPSKPRGSGLKLRSGISTGDALLIAAREVAIEAAAARESIWQRTQLSAQKAQQAEARDATENPQPSKTVSIFVRPAPAILNMKDLVKRLCEKIERKQTTTYVEVADELVMDYLRESFSANEKNIRRRIYDALGVLVGVNMVAQRKKEYHWLGTPSGLRHGLVQTKADKLALVQVKADKLALVARIEEQSDHLQELLKTHTALNNLIERNKHVVADDLQGQAHSCSLQLPFNLIQANPKYHIVVQHFDAHQRVHFDFHSETELDKRPFKMYSSDVVIRHIGLDEHPVELAPRGFNPLRQLRMEADMMLTSLQQETSTAPIAEQLNELDIPVSCVSHLGLAADELLLDDLFPDVGTSYQSKFAQLVEHVE